MPAASSEAKFREAFTAHFNAINRYCLRRISLDEVNDVTAEIFAVAWRKVDRMPDDALPWLYGVARNEIRNRRRSHRRTQALKLKLSGQAESQDLGPEPIIVRNSELQELMTALRSLSDNDQELLLLHTHEELDYEQMGVALGCSPEAARKRLARAIGRLRRAGGIPDPKKGSQGIRAMKGGDQ